MSSGFFMTDIQQDRKFDGSFKPSSLKVWEGFHGVISPLFGSEVRALQALNGAQSW